MVTERNGLRQREALVHFYLRRDPKGMDPDEFARCWADVQFAMVFEERLIIKKHRRG